MTPAHLSLHAESDYTFFMRVGVLLGCVFLVVPRIVFAADSSPHERYQALNALRVDPASIYEISAANRIELRRADVRFLFEEGHFGFFAALDGRLTGAVFAGRGHILAVPHGIVEKQQMARFLGAPLLDQEFTSAYLRFNDTTADDLLQQFHKANLVPKPDAEFALRWDSFLAIANPGQSLRLLFSELLQDPKPYFYAGVDGTVTGAFDVILDLQREEPLLIGQSRKSGARTFYDVWASYKPPDSSLPAVPFRALRYNIDTAILANTSLNAKTEIRIHAQDGGRLLVFQLSRMLEIESVTGDHGESLAYFQNEGLNPHDRASRGNDYLYVVLPASPSRGAEFTLRFRYHGNVIEDAGNGVLFVGARESWYPHLGDTADFADYDLSIRWPRRLRLAATGMKVDEHEDGDFRVGHWRTEIPVSVAGFNLGDYASTSLSSASRTIDLYANHQLEQSLNSRLEKQSLEAVPRLPGPFGAEGHRGTKMMSMAQTAPPSPADALKQLSRQIDASIRFYETFSGPFPFQKLSVSQIPGAFGQGWPGLLYLSTFSFLPSEAQHRAGLSDANQELFTELVPFHEVAHQWWGNVVGWHSYRDQWINEAIANYLALLFADSQKNTDHSLRVWLGRYRRHLLERLPTADQPTSEIGAVELGSRLTSSKSPNGFEDVIYAKGSWIMHMLREMLRQPGSKTPDARFIALLRTLETNYAYRALSTADLQREVEGVMTPSMDLDGSRSLDWFFEQWVRGVGIPHYHVQFSVHHQEQGYVVRGKLFQDNVPRSFVAPVPLYASSGNGHPVPLGVVIASGPETSFHFLSQNPPAKILIDPQMTLLCVPE
jgi:Peptidase family M1 domain